MSYFILCFLLILFSMLGCSPRQETPGQREDSSYNELTLPQIPKLTEPFKPTNKDIQIALRNAGFYKGKIDGDIGPMSKQAIREFQVENNLEVDGELGPRTWEILKKYLYNQSGE
jgi:hypothetical protein